MASYFCLITVLGDGSGISPPQQPPGIWGPSDPRPTNPIAGWNPGTGTFPPGQQPPGIWGPTDPRPTNPIAGWNPGTGTFPQPPYPDNSLPPFPSHPIYFPPPGGQPPLGIWGPTDPRPTNPIARPGNPNYPGGDPRPDQGLPPFPSHPIVLPPDLPPELPSVGKIEWKTAWTPQTGWIVVGIPAEGTLVPTPS